MFAISEISFSLVERNSKSPQAYVNGVTNFVETPHTPTRTHTYTKVNAFGIQASGFCAKQFNNSDIKNHCICLYKSSASDYFHLLSFLTIHISSMNIKHATIFIQSGQMNLIFWKKRTNAKTIKNPWKTHPNKLCVFST